MKVLIATHHLPLDIDTHAPQHVLHEIRHLARMIVGELFVVSMGAVNYSIPNVRFFNQEALVFRKRDVMKLFIEMRASVPFSHRRWVLRYWMDSIIANAQISHLIRQQGIDLVHSHWFFPGCSGAVGSARVCNVPVIVTARGGDILVDKSIGFGWRLSAYKDRLMRWALGHAQAITVASAASRQAIEEMVARLERLEAIPNGVDFRLFDHSIDGSHIKHQHISNCAEFLLLSVGALKKSKGHDTLIHAMRILRGHGIAAKLIIVGEGDEQTNLNYLIDTFGLKENVELLGGKNFQELPEYFAACDCFVLCSHAEGFGNVFLEALAMKKPLVATRVGFVKDHLVDGKHARLVPIGDAEATAAVIADTLSHSIEAHAMAKRGFDLVANSFTIEKRIQAFVKLYEKVLKNHSK